jgi:hypothetical protein
VAQGCSCSVPKAPRFELAPTCSASVTQSVRHRRLRWVAVSELGMPLRIGRVLLHDKLGNASTLAFLVRPRIFKLLAKHMQLERTIAVKNLLRL